MIYVVTLTFDVDEDTAGEAGAFVWELLHSSDAHPALLGDVKITGQPKH